MVGRVPEALVTGLVPVRPVVLIHLEVLAVGAALVHPPEVLVLLQVLPVVAVPAVLVRPQVLLRAVVPVCLPGVPVHPPEGLARLGLEGVARLCQVVARLVMRLLHHAPVVVLQMTQMSHAAVHLAAQLHLLPWLVEVEELQQQRQLLCRPPLSQDLFLSR